MPLLLTDLDDTLVDRSAAFAAWAVDYAATHDRPADAAWLVGADRRGLERREVLAALIAERFGLGAHAAADVLTTLRRGLVDRMHLPAETAAALGALRDDGWAVVVVTNGTTAQQTAKIDRLGLGDRVDGWVISEAAGVRKPDPAIFEQAAAVAGSSFAGGWMVGDSPSADVAGGRAVGLATAWVRCGRPWTEPSFTPTVQVDRFAEVAAHLLG